jgi:hypothetical protein
VCWCGDLTAGEQALTALRRFGRPLADHIGPMPYVVWQHMQDGGAPAGRHHYWKTANYAHLNDAVLDQLADAANDLPTPVTEIHLQHLGGAVARVPAQDTAFADRHAAFFVNLIGCATWPDEFPAMRARIRALYDSIAADALPSRLPNFTDQEDGDVTAGFEPSKAQRLASIRRRYDRSGLFAPLGAAR